MVVQPCRIARCATGSFRSIQPFFFFPRSLFLFFTRTRTLEYPVLASSTDSWNLDIAPRPKALLPNCRDITDPLFSLFTHTNWNWKRWADPSIFPCLDAVWTRRWLLWLVQRDTKFWKFFLRYSMKFSVL